LVSKLSNRIISIGEEYCDQFISKDKIVVIYNSLDFENLNSLLSNNIDIKKNIYNDSNSILIGFVGLVTYYKGIWDFIDSAEILLKQNIKNIKFIICGRVPKSTFIDKIINYLQRGYLISPADYIKSLNHKNNFILVNQTEEILKIINSFDILVSCEGTATGRPIIEAQALGKPVVAVLPSENTKVLLNGITGLIVQGHDVNLLASAIKKLIIEPGLRKKMGELGRNHAEENFDSKKNILKIQEIYDIILEGKKSTKDL
jgi:glycosyltransferase involved in cell wall biosynthesis